MTPHFRLQALLFAVLATAALVAPQTARAAESDGADCTAPLTGTWTARVPERDASGLRTGEPAVDFSLELKPDGRYDWFTHAGLYVTTQFQGGTWACAGDRLVLEVNKDHDPRVPYEGRVPAPRVSRTDTFVIEVVDATHVVLVPVTGGYRYAIGKLPPPEPERALEDPRTAAEVATLGYLRCAVALGGAALFGDAPKADVDRYRAWMKARPDYDADYASRNVEAIFRQRADDLFVMGAYERHERGESADAAIRTSVADCLAAMDGRREP